MIPAIVKLQDQMREVLQDLVALKKDSHPPKPSLDAADFDRWKQSYEAETNRRINSLEKRIRVLEADKEQR